MLTILKSISIDRAPADVFSYLSDFTHDPDWRSEVLSSERVTAGREGVTDRYEQRMRVPGLELRTHLFVTVCDPPRHLVAEGDSEGLSASQDYVLEPAGDGTLLQVTTRIEPKGVLRVGEPIAMRFLKKRADDNLRCLKRLLERRR